MKARAVKKAAREAEKLHAQMYGGGNPDEILDGLDDTPVPGDTPVAASVDATPGDTSPAEPVPDDVPKSDDTPVEASATGAASEPVSKEPVSDTPAGEGTDLTHEQELEKAQHKYSVLQGMHRKMLDENNDLRARIHALEETASAAPAPSPVAPDTTPSHLITEDDVEDYGADLIGMVKRAAQEAVSPELAKLQTENEQLRNQISGVTTTISTRAKEDIYSTLATQVPNWQEINKSEDYLFWLAQRDPFSGERRHDLLTQAFEANDSARVINFFKAFLNEDMTVTPPKPAADDTPAPVAPKIDLVSMAAPGRAQAPGKPNNQTDTRVYSRAEISAHYKAVQTGKFGGTDADKNRIEKAFIKAANEGRVQ